jgi:hypothetical protein
MFDLKLTHVYLVAYITISNTWNRWTFFFFHKTNTLLNCVCIIKIFQNLCIYIFFDFASRQRHYFLIFQDEIFSIRISWCQSDKKVVLCLEYSKSVWMNMYRFLGHSGATTVILIEVWWSVPLFLLIKGIFSFDELLTYLFCYFYFWSLIVTFGKTCLTKKGYSLVCLVKI